MADWCGLPSALLGVVARKMGILEQARMNCVFKGWRMAMKDESYNQPPRPSLWLLLPFLYEDGDQGYHYAFPGFSKTPAFRVRVYHAGWTDPSLKNTFLVGSSLGWMMIMDEFSRLRAFDPISRTALEFPPAGEASFRKAIIVPARGGGGFKAPVAAVLRRRVQNEMQELAFSAAGDSAWSEIPTGVKAKDIVAHEGRIYALCNSSRVLVCDLGDDIIPSAAPGFEVIDATPPLSEFWKSYLGVMGGDLIILRWAFRVICPARGERCLPAFEVLRMEKAEGGRPDWVKARSLAGHAIVLGNGGIAALPVEEFGDLKEDCIYSLVRPVGDFVGDKGITAVNIVSGEVWFEPAELPFTTAFWFMPSVDLAPVPKNKPRLHRQQIQ